MENNRDQVPYIVHESTVARMERTTRRLIIALLFTIVLWFTSNALWLLAWINYDYIGTETTTTTEVDGTDGIANYIGNNGDIANGENKNDNNNPDTGETE